jgi:hypothetical protein
MGAILGGGHPTYDDPVTDLAKRYGAPSRPRRPVVIMLAVVLAAALIGWLAWATFLHARPEVTSQLVGFRVHGQHSATATFTVVRRSADVRASCVLQASAADHATVGQLTVRVASGDTEQRLTRSMRTERQASAVDLVGCTAPGQSQPR